MSLITFQKQYLNMDVIRTVLKKDWINTAFDKLRNF